MIGLNIEDCYKHDDSKYCQWYEIGNIETLTNRKADSDASAYAISRGKNDADSELRKRIRQLNFKILNVVEEKPDDAIRPGE